jgi:hypothetical protein
MSVQYNADPLKHVSRHPLITMTAANSPLLPEVHLGPQPADQPSLQLASEGVQRYVWHCAYGEMLIEVRDGAAFVNGSRVTSIHELRADAPPA